MVDTQHLKCCGLKPCGFDSHLAHHILKKLSFALKGCRFESGLGHHRKKNQKLGSFFYGKIDCRVEFWYKLVAVSLECKGY